MKRPVFFGPMFHLTAGILLSASATRGCSRPLDFTLPGSSTYACRHSAQLHRDDAPGNLSSVSPLLGYLIAASLCWAAAGPVTDAVAQTAQPERATSDDAANGKGDRPLTVAQDADRDDTTDSGDSTNEFLVTAQKREQAIPDVPLTIQVLDDGLLDANTARNLRDVLKHIPGSSQGGSYSSANVRTQLRGIAQEAGDPTVGYYIGDAPFLHPGQTFAPIVRMVDIERVEVLKGPQGTLYGSGAMGGVIRVMPMAPDLETFEGEIRAGWSTLADGGDWHTLDVTANIPLVAGRFGTRLSVAGEKEGGFASFQPHALNPATFGYEPYGPAVDEFGSGLHRA